MVNLFIALAALRRAIEAACRRAADFYWFDRTRFAVAVGGIVLVVLCIVGLLLMTPPARSQTFDDDLQRWIHRNEPQCCDHRDCKPATATWTPEGWRVEGVDGVVPDKVVRRWHFPIVYACVLGGKVRCLFVTGGG
jgi:hypothetical protein